MRDMYPPPLTWGSCSRSERVDEGHISSSTYIGYMSLAPGLQVCKYVIYMMCVCVSYGGVYVCMRVCLYVYIIRIHTCYVLTKPPIPSSRCKCFVVLRPA